MTLPSSHSPARDDDSAPQAAQDQYNEAETVARREAALKRMLTTPPKPLKKMVSNPTGRVTNPKGRAKTKSA
jgi:hypothetical protein